MVLSRNDKIIAILAVVILIAVAFAIIFYQPAEEELPKTSMLKAYSVTWTKQTGEKAITEGLYAGKKSPYTGNFSIDVPEGSVLTSANVEVTWKDDHTYGLIFKRGLDTLTVKINLGGKTETYNGKGSGNKTFTFSIDEVPADDIVEANDIYAVEENMTIMFSGKNSASFDVEASIKTGEKIRRPLKYLRDKGNRFNLKIYYEYYIPLIEETNGGDEVPPEEPPVEEGTSYLGIMIATGNFGRI